MRTWSYHVTAESAATPERVYELLADAPGWADWAPGVSHAAWASPGSPDPVGAGAVRRMGMGRVRADETILEATPGRHQGYTVELLPLRGYRGDVRLTPTAAGGTHIDWSGSFGARLPGTGRLLQAVLGRMIGRFADALARAAERPAQSGTG